MNGQSLALVSSSELESIRKKRAELIQENLDINVEMVLQDTPFTELHKDFDNPQGYDDRFIPIWGGRQWTSATDSGRAELRRNYHAYTVSQFLHGEQAAMLAAARIVEVLPDARSKIKPTGTGWERVKREAAANAPIDDQTGPYDPNDTSAVAAYWKAATITRRRGRPPVSVKRPTLNRRVDADVLDAFKATGPGWQTRINALLRDAVAHGVSKT